MENKPAPAPLPRDVFVNTIYEAALKNRDIWFISADFGAQALDAFRANLKDQFIHAGISEQNMVDIAAGLALNGKTVYIYAMAPFVTFRCFEQVKVALATMNLPVTVIGVGAGYSYDDAGPTHYATEDISCMRALANVEILSPSDTQTTREAAKLTYTKPAFRYVRLDRKNLPTIYQDGDTRFLKEGVCEIDSGDDICILTTGYMMQKARKAKEILAKDGINVGIVDIFRIKPIRAEVLKAVVGKYKMAVTLEEHFLSGGLGSAVAEVFVDNDINIPLRRIGITDNYYFDNGGREYVHKLCGIDVDSVVKKVKAFSAQLSSSSKKPRVLAKQA